MPDFDRELVINILWAWSHLMVLLMTLILYRLSSRLLVMIKEIKSISDATIAIPVQTKDIGEGPTSTCIGTVGSSRPSDAAS